MPPTSRGSISSTSPLIAIAPMPKVAVQNTTTAAISKPLSPAAE